MRKKGKDFQDADEWCIWNSRWSLYIEYNLRIIEIVLDIHFDIVYKNILKIFFLFIISLELLKLFGNKPNYISIIIKSIDRHKVIIFFQSSLQ